MSDFLATLAERSRGQAPAIRPRLPARFEPEGLRSRAPANDAAGWAGEIDADVPAQSGREPAVPPRPAATPAPHPEFPPPTPRPARGAPPAPDSPARPQVRSLATDEPAPRATPRPRPLERDQDEPPPRSRRATKDVSPDEPVLRPRVTSVVPAPMVIRVPATALPARAGPCEGSSGRPCRGEARGSCRAGRRASQRAAIARGPATPRDRAAGAAAIAACGAAGPGDPCHHRPDRGARVRPPPAQKVAAGQPAAR